MTFESHDRKLSIAERKVFELKALRSLFISQKNEVIDKIAKAESYLEHKGQVLEVLNEAQQVIQAKTQGVIADLLTSLIREIMPEKRDEVVLETGIKANKNTLEFMVRNPSGQLENIFADRGGSLQNIISMGLRFVMLSRTKNRRILLLDESDCWLSPKYIRAFAKIMSQLSKKIGVQVIYVSHHDPEHFKGLARRIHLDRQDGEIYAEIDEDDGFESYELGEEESGNESLFEGAGIRYIRLTNFRGHSNTMIELSPGLNIITGDNDLGKSAVIESVQSIVNNTGRDGLVRHGALSSNVELGIEDGLTVQWSYRRRGSKKTQYKITDEENNILEVSDSGNEVPDFLNAYLAMGEINGLNLHVASQDSPNFLIDRSVSTHFRADALSLDKESQQIQRMLKLHSEKCKEAKREINDSQRSLVKVKNALLLLEGVDDMVGAVDQLKAIKSEMGERSASLETIKSTSQSLVSHRRVVEVLSMTNELSSPTAPMINEPSSVLEMGGKIARLQKVVNALGTLHDVKEVHAPEIKDELRLGQVLGGIELAHKVVNATAAVSNIVAPAAPQIHESTRLLELASRIKAASSALDKESALATDCASEISVLENSKSQIFDELGFCPTCKQPTKGNGHVH